MKEERKNYSSLIEVKDEQVDRIFSAPELAEKLNEIMDRKKERISESLKKAVEDVCSLLGEEFIDLLLQSESEAKFTEKVKKRVKYSTINQGLRELLDSDYQFTPENLAKLITDELVEDSIDKVEMTTRLEAVNAASTALLFLS